MTFIQVVKPLAHHYSSESRKRLSWEDQEEEERHWWNSRFRIEGTGTHGGKVTREMERDLETEPEQLVPRTRSLAKSEYVLMSRLNWGLLEPGYIRCKKSGGRVRPA